MNTEKIAKYKKSLENANIPANDKTKIEAEINIPCDTNGLLKDFEQRFKAGNNTTTITGKGGKIYINSDCEDQINKYKEQVAYLLTQVGENRTHTENQTQVIEVNLTWWEKLKSGWFGDGCFVVALSFFLYALYKIKSYKLRV